MEWKNILEHIPSIRRPISLAALIVLVLYGVYKLILGLPVFENIGSEQTFQLLDSLAFYLFIIALVAITLSILRPILLRITKSNSQIDKRKPMTAPKEVIIEILSEVNKFGYKGVKTEFLDDFLFRKFKYSKELRRKTLEELRDNEYIEVNFDVIRITDKKYIG